MKRPIRIANCSGFLGDRASAAKEMVEGGPIDVLTGDYLAELTLAILARQRLNEPSRGFATTFVDQMEQVMGECLDRDIRIVSNAGGVNVAGLVDALHELAGSLGLAPTIAAVTGDDVLDRHDLAGTKPYPSAQVLTSNAYLGGWGIAAALEHGADIVVTGRVADASLVVGPAAWYHQWARDDWDRLAGAVVAGHVIECGAQATGGNYSFFEEVPRRPGFPIANIAADGSAVITKHPGTGGAVTVGTVTAQLVYEIASPRYLNPDVVARLDTVDLLEIGDDLVAITGVTGEPAPATTKVAVTGIDGWHNTVTFLVAGLDIEAKAELALEALWERAGSPDSFDFANVDLLRTDQPDPPNHEASFAQLRVTVADSDSERVGRSFSNAAVELALSNYPGLTLAAPPASASPRPRYWAGSISQVPSEVTINGASFDVAAPGTDYVPSVVEPDAGDAPQSNDSTVATPIGRLVGARSGDKGGDANLGVWARTETAYGWLAAWLTTEQLRRLLPELEDLDVHRYPLPNLRAINFVLVGYLDGGVAGSHKVDPQAKGLAEYFRAKVVPIPEALLAV